MGGLSAKCTMYKQWWRTLIADGFYRLGYHVALNPWKTILFSCIVTTILALGLFKFHNEKDQFELYVPKHNSFYADTKFVMSRYGVIEREQNVLIEAPNVLEPEVIRKLLKIHNELMVVNGTDSDGKHVNFKDLCYKLPVITSLQLEDFTGEDECASVNDDKGSICKVLNKIPLDCLQETILEIFKFREDEIPATTEEVIELIAITKVSPYSGIQKDFEEYFGGVKRNASGTIISAKSLMSFYKLYGNYSQDDANKGLAGADGIGSFASDRMMAWEKGFLDKMETLKKTMSTTNFNLYYQSFRSYGDLSVAVTTQEVDKHIIGVFLMFVYLHITLSKFGWVEIRFWMAVLGLLSIGMAYIAGSGVCSLLGISYGPIQSALPFLLMGLGVDDIFVVMSCYRRLQAAVNSEKPLEERIGLMLMNAGASITITSITDIIAFAVGGLAALPIMQSFCLYSAICIFFMYLLMITFFVAIFTLDERRVTQNRNGFVPCIIHSQKTSKVCMEKSLMQQLLKWIFSKFILTKPGKIIIIITTVGFTAINFLGLLELKFRFDPTHHVPVDTYLSDYMHEVEQYFPNMGSDASVIIGKINYTQDMPKLIHLSEKIENSTDLLYQIDAWPLDFKKFVEEYYGHKDIAHLTDLEWRTYLYQFLYCHVGGKYTRYFKFDTKLECGVPTTNVTISQIGFKFKFFKDPDEFLPAKEKLKDMLLEANITSGEGFSTVWGKIMLMWVPDETVKPEIIRNIILALIGVMACTAVIIASFKVCFLILTMIILTLVNVAGTMHHMGMMLDMVSYIAIQLSIGLCVDYAAHISHTFVSLDQGDRNSRALNTVLSIGAAVIYGGFSTFLAISILLFSKTNSYRAFVHVNTLCIFFGLFHGVVLLPVILSMCGPKDQPQPVVEEEMVHMSSFIDKRVESDNRNGKSHLMNGSTEKEIEETVKLNNAL